MINARPSQRKGPTVRFGGPEIRSVVVRRVVVRRRSAKVDGWFTDGSLADVSMAESSVFERYCKCRAEFVIAKIAGPDVADLSLTKEFGSGGREQQVAARWANRPAKSRVSDAGWIAG
ncbi:hypothetical protein [Pseudorhodoplanes sp.]|uniref:hypothetical protein n=1 Tax=Pseudorhodoplanes sp. TaxID=1934341 RepID=UPI003D0E21B3